ncbi:hypothetical protein AC731_010340 [Thauera humireducens]|uniref:Uncharacterized protein n=2 Tax=Thauera humireducens TaxID=1134435 RepID=A0A127K5S6_9RHOO|nr:hypothetical protein AC731_010340 [Thauera humireducens]
MIIQQTASDEEVFIKRMMKLDGLVNNPSYIVTDGFKTYFGSRGIGYKNESGCYMQFQKLNEDHDRIAAYSLKSASTQIAVLDGPTLNDDFFTFEPEHVTINKREWKEREQYIAAMKMGAKNDQAKEQARVDRDAEVQDL